MLRDRYSCKDWLKMLHNAEKNNGFILSEKHRDIFLKFIERKSYRFIGIVYNLSPERVRQIINRACRKIEAGQIKYGFQGLSERTRNCLLQNGIKDINILSKIWNESNGCGLLHFRNFGKKCHREVYDYLKKNKMTKLPYYPSMFTKLNILKEY